MTDKGGERGQVPGGDVGMGREDVNGDGGSLVVESQSVVAVLGRLHDLADGQGPLLARLSSAVGEMKELAEQLGSHLATVEAERDQLRRANGEMALVFAEQLDTINRQREVLSACGGLIAGLRDEYAPAEWRASQAHRLCLMIAAVLGASDDGEDDGGE